MKPGYLHILFIMFIFSIMNSSKYLYITILKVSFPMTSKQHDRKAMSVPKPNSKFKQTQIYFLN